jgi:hypothetical protein
MIILLTNTIPKHVEQGNKRWRLITKFRQLNKIALETYHSKIYYRKIKPDHINGIRRILAMEKKKKLPINERITNHV